MKKTFPFLIAILLLSSNCLNNVEDLSIPADEPENVSYSNDVQPIFNTHCTNCHGNNGGISFEDYTSTTSGNSNNYGTSLIIAGDADNSGLIDKLGSNPQVGSTMPPSGPLTNDEIAIIRAWIDQGALNN